MKQIITKNHSKFSSAFGAKVYGYQPILILEVLKDSTLLDSDWFSENILSLGYEMRDHIEGNSIFVCKQRGQA